MLTSKGPISPRITATRTEFRHASTLGLWVQAERCGQCSVPSTVLEIGKAPKVEPFYVADCEWYVPRAARASEGTCFVFNEDLAFLGASALKKRENSYLRSTRYKGRAKVHFDLAIEYRVDVRTFIALRLDLLRRTVPCSGEKELRRAARA